MLTQEHDWSKKTSINSIIKKWFTLSKSDVRNLNQSTALAGILLIRRKTLNKQSNHCLLKMHLIYDNCYLINYIICFMLFVRCFHPSRKSCTHMKTSPLPHLHMSK